MRVILTTDVKIPEDRNTLIRELYAQGNLTQAQIGTMFYLHPTRVSQIVNSES